MAKTLKLKIDGVVYGNEVPEDVEELELECAALANGAFENRKDLRSVTLIGTEIIGKRAFSGCENLAKINLPETLRTIKDEAFKDTVIENIVIPPGVTTIGSCILIINFFSNVCPVMEIYLKDGKTAPFFDGSKHYAPHVRLTARSLETGEILYRFMVFNCMEEVLNGQGANFTDYDESNHIFDLKFTAGRRDPQFLFIAVYLRIHYPTGLTEERIDELKTVLSNAAAGELTVMINELGLVYEFKRIEKFEYYDEIKIKSLAELICYSMTKDIPEVTEILVKNLHKRYDELIELDPDELLMLLKISQRMHTVEFTAVLLQTLHEKGCDNGGIGDLEL